MFRKGDLVIPQVCASMLFCGRTYEVDRDQPTHADSVWLKITDVLSIPVNPLILLEAPPGD